MDAAILREFERLIVSGCAPLLMVLGYKLFVKGITKEFSISANYDKWRGKAANLAPGSFCFLLGTVLGGYILFSKVTVDPTPASDHGTRSPEKTAAKPPTTARYYSGFGGGGTTNRPPTDQVRRVLSDFGFCVLNSADEAAKTKCIEDVTAKFRKVPRPEDLEQIERDEQKAAEGDAEAQARVTSWLSAIAK